MTILEWIDYGFIAVFFLLVGALIVVVNGMTWSFLFAPVAIGALMLAAFAFAWHNLIGGRAWPQRWR